MALYRLRAYMRFKKSGNLATQAHDQMQSRFDQAVTIREGTPQEEPKRNTVIDDGNRQEFLCDLPLTDQSVAQDAYAILSDAKVIGNAEPIPTDAGTVPSYVEIHTCHHDESPPQACTVDNRAEGPA